MEYNEYISATSLSYPEHSPAQLSPQSKFQFRETKDKSFGAEERGICFLSSPLLPHKLNIQVSIKSGELKRQGEGGGLIYYTSTTTASPQP